MQEFITTFAALQNARHTADYDASRQFTLTEAQSWTDRAEETITDFMSVDEDERRAVAVQALIRGDAAPDPEPPRGAITVTVMAPGIPVHQAGSGCAEVLIHEHQVVRKAEANTAQDRLRHGHQPHPVELHLLAQVGNWRALRLSRENDQARTQSKSRS